MYPYYFTFTTFTKGRWVGERILDVFAREFRAHPAEEYVSENYQFSLRGRGFDPRLGPKIFFHPKNIFLNALMIKQSLDVKFLT